ncbi:MAG: DUF167 domain-containing protein [Patescibacteria group bacterium]
MQIVVKTNSKQHKLVKIDENNFIAYIKTLPKQGKANKELVELLSEKFKIPKNRIWIKYGLKSKNKIIKIID